MPSTDIVLFIVNLFNYRMKVKITPTGESAQVMEFNVSLPCGANASIAPVSTLTVTQRWAKVVNVSTTGTEYVQVTSS